ncbi:karyopherin [Knufia obscura]|uniref:Karyopherin n=2 Tax=Knufia TaxID=430999 RepID=A0AAN8IC65_9EURO|nr:karyopherin [Knufia obscura]KAK5958041.1 karyopherin [Knufia fluminis]
MAQTNGIDGHTNSSSAVALDISTVIQALEVVHNPSSKNDHRREATAYLEDLKSHDGISEAGFALANNTSQQPLVRYYGLSLLEHVIKRQSFALNEQGSADLRQLVLRLSLTLDNTPEPFIRNKIAALWVELSKRSWALDWFDLDEALQQLWSQSDAGKEFVLTVLENLSDDVFVREDATAILRDRDLNNAVVEIFTSHANYAGGLKIGDTTYQMRKGEEGWTARITVFLAERLQRGTSDKESRRLCAAALGTLRSLFTWIMTPAIVSANTMTVVCDALTQADTEVILAAVDTLLAFYSRKTLEPVEVQALVHPLCHPSSVGVLEQVYTWSVVGPDDTLDPKYGISKKLSELLFHLASWLASADPPNDTDLVPYLNLLVAVARHDSLIVSIAAIHAWHKLLDAGHTWRKSASVQACIQPSLQVAMQRIIAYDMLPADTEEAAVQFVNEEIELHPERQGFYINYRRLCFAIVESISNTYLQDALGFIFSAVDTGLGEVYASDQAEDHGNYQRLSMTMLRADALFSVVDGALKGVHKFTSAHDAASKEESSAAQREELLHRGKEWSTQMLSQYKFRDPGTTLRQIKTAVEASSKLLKHDTEFAFVVLQHIISALNTPHTNNSALADSYTELHQYAIAELRRLCSEHATYFITFYDQLENKLGQIMSSNLDSKFQIDLKAILMLLVEHAKGIDENVRLDRLRSFVSPLLDQWQQQEGVLSSFESFVRSQAFDQVGPFMMKIGASRYADWTEIALAPEAQQIQQTMNEGALRLPLRETRVLLSMSTDKVTSESSLHNVICEIWLPLLQPLIHSVLRLISYNHQLHDVSSWPNLSPDQYIIVRRILRDRYWQSGISGGSMQEFHNKVKSTKTTLEGFASSIRGRIRLNLENCYSIVHTLGRLGTHFYGLSELPQMVSSALLASSQNLSPHHFGLLLSMLPRLIEECPPANRQHFLTPVLAELTTQIDNVCTREWEKVNARGGGEIQQQANGDLSDEMRDESVLRQMTGRAVNMVTSWFDISREHKLSTSKKIVNKSGNDSFRNFVLGNRTILEPLLMFCTHSIGFRDTKTCTTMVHALQKFVPAFSSEAHLQGQDAAAVREFISTEMLKASINSLNDGYFADYHQALAILIALIWLSFGLPAHVAATETQSAHDRPAWTETPRSVLLSIPGLNATKIDDAGMQLAQLTLAGKQRTMRAIILNLLENVRGVRVSELGKYDNKQERSGLLEKYKQRDALGMQGMEEGSHRNGDEGPDLGGVADMFG